MINSQQNYISVYCIKMMEFEGVEKNFKGPYADKLYNYYSVLLHNNLIIGTHKDKSAGIKEYAFQFL